MNALKFPELYHELQKRRYLSIKTFLIWTWKAVYQVTPRAPSSPRALLPLPGPSSPPRAMAPAHRRRLLSRRAV